MADDSYADSYDDDFDDPDIEEVREEETAGAAEKSEEVAAATSLSPRYDDSFVSASDRSLGAMSAASPRRVSRRMAMGSFAPFNQTRALADQPAAAMVQPYVAAAPAPAYSVAASSRPTLSIPDWSTGAEAVRIGEPSPSTFLSPGSSREGEGGGGGGGEGQERGHGSARPDSPGHSPAAEADVSQYGLDEDEWEQRPTSSSSAVAAAAASDADAAPSSAVTPTATAVYGSAGFFPAHSAPAAPARLHTGEGDEDHDAGAGSHAAAYTSPVFSASAGPLGVSSFNMTPPPAAASGGAGYYSARFFSGTQPPDASPADISHFGRPDTVDEGHDGRGGSGASGDGGAGGGGGGSGWVMSVAAASDSSPPTPLDRSEGFDAFETAAAGQGISLSLLSSPHATVSKAPAHRGMSPPSDAIATPNLGRPFTGAAQDHDRAQSTTPAWGAPAPQDEFFPASAELAPPDSGGNERDGGGDAGEHGDLVAEEFEEWEESPALAPYDEYAPPASAPPASAPAPAPPSTTGWSRPTSSGAAGPTDPLDSIIAFPSAAHTNANSPPVAAATTSAADAGAAIATAASPPAEQKDAEEPRSPLVTVQDDANLDDSGDFGLSPAPPAHGRHEEPRAHSVVAPANEAEAVAQPSQHDEASPVPPSKQQQPQTQHPSAPPSQAASPRSKPGSAPPAVAAPLPPLPPVPAAAPASPSPVERLLAHQASVTEAHARHQAELESGRTLAAQRTRDTEAAAEAARAHRRPLLAQMPDTHYAPAPVATREANLPRVLQSAPHTVPWQPAHAPVAVSTHVASKAVDWTRCAAPSAAALPSERYDRAAASFAQFLRTGSSSSSSSSSSARAQRASPFSTLDSFDRFQAGSDPMCPYNELQVHGLSERAKALVKRAAGASAAIAASGLGDSFARSGLVPARHRTGAFETPAAVAASRLSNPALASILSYTSSSSASATPTAAPGLSARARVLATGHASTAAGGASAYSTQAAAGTGLARLAERRAEESQRVMLLRLAWRDREDEQAALAASMAAASADSQRREAHDSSVLAVHDALRRREAAERRRLLRGDPDWPGPETRSADAGFDSAFERERAARLQFARLRNRGVDLTPRLERRVLARGADCEADEEVSNSDLASARSESSSRAGSRYGGLGDDADAEEWAPHDLSIRSQQYDENGDSMPPTPRIIAATTTNDDSLQRMQARVLQPRFHQPQQQSQPQAWSPYSTGAVAGGESEEKYPYPSKLAHVPVHAPRLDVERMEWQSGAAADDLDREPELGAVSVSPGRVFVRTDASAFAF